MESAKTTFPVTPLHGTEANTARDGDGLFWEINGTKGDIRVSGPSGHTQMVQLCHALSVGLRLNAQGARPSDG